MCDHYCASGEWRSRVDACSLRRIAPLFDLSAPRAAVEADDLHPCQVGEILTPALPGWAVCDQLAATSAHWLLIPAKPGLTWAEWSKIRRSCSNACGEEADRRWPFTAAARTGRCLIPGEAFFEWGEGPNGERTEYRFSYPNQRAFFFAGLCSRTSPADVGPILTYAMVTKAAGGDAASVGALRQPMILAPDEIAAWLDGANPVRGFTDRLDPPGAFTWTAAKQPAVRALA